MRLILELYRDVHRHSGFSPWAKPEKRKIRSDQIAFVPSWPLTFSRVVLYSLVLTLLIQLLKQRSVVPNTSVMLVLSILH